VICLDQMGPEAAKSFPGQQLVRTASVTEPQLPAGRARQEIDYGRRGKGYIFGTSPRMSASVFSLTIVIIKEKSSFWCLKELRGQKRQFGAIPRQKRSRGEFYALLRLTKPQHSGG